jgi:hypothetical protein
VDTTQVDAPDTPAPVFAARALKNVIWGHSTAVEHPSPAKTKPSENERVESTTANSNNSGNAVPIDTRSPTKLNSILLTPGTGASRRKRVSFGRDVKAGNNADFSPLAATSTRNGRQRKRTTLQQALENSRPAKSKAPEQAEKEPEPANTDDESEWEDDDVCCNHDLTVDLNEPHSESGKYWKAEWARYREEAKSDIEQLVKYKANAKSYAAKKDNEASQLSQKLKEEQAKVAEMEKKMAEMATRLAAAGRHGSDRESTSLSRDIAKQNSLISGYRERVKELEDRLKEVSNQAKPDRVSRLRIDTSPRTEQSIYEVSRELRKARSELRQMDRLREEVKRLKSHLATSRERVAELEIQTSAGEGAESTRVARLDKQLREVKEDFRRKDTELRKLKEDYESLKRDAKSRTTEAMQVLRVKNEKIDELEKRLKAAEAANATTRRQSLYSTTAEQNTITRDLKSSIESLSRVSKYDRARPINRHGRAASVEDITLDMTQRSLLTDKNDYTLSTPRQAKVYSGDVLNDWTADIPTFDLEAKDTKRQAEISKPDDEMVLEDKATQPSQRVARRVERTLSSDRVASDVLIDRVNGSTGRVSRLQSTAYNDPPANRNENRADERVSTRTASLAENQTSVHDALDRLARQPRTLSSTTRAVSSVNDTPAIDLVQDRFSQLGAPSSTDRSVLGNKSRCTLPAERLARARARLAQKKEKRKASAQDLDKENVKP